MSTLLQQSGAMDTFAVCLGVAGSPGVLSLGGADQQYYTGDMVYTSFSGSEGYYTVDLTGVGINGQELCSGPGCVKPEGSTSPTIVDSGTPPLLIYTTAYNALANNQVSCESDSDCLITLQMGDICINSAGLMTCDGTCQLDTSLVREATSAINGQCSPERHAARRPSCCRFACSRCFRLGPCYTVLHAQRLGSLCDLPAPDRRWSDNCG